VLNKNVFDYVLPDENCIFEKGPLEHLTKDRELMVFEHNDFWQCMDTKRDFDLLTRLASNKKDAPWMIWEQGHSKRK